MQENNSSPIGKHAEEIRLLEEEIVRIDARLAELQSMKRDFEIVGFSSKPKGGNPERTANAIFTIPILEALIEAGGSLPPGEVGDRVKYKLRKTLTAFDFTNDPSGTRKRWDDAMRYRRKELVIHGLLEDSERGVWRISKSGIEFYNKFRKIG